MAAGTLRVSLPGGGTAERKSKRAYSHAIAREIGGVWEVVSWTSMSPVKAKARELALRPVGFVSSGKTWGAVEALEVEE